MKDGSLLDDIGCSVRMWWLVLITCACVVFIVASCSVYQAVQESKAMRDCVARNGMFERQSNWVRCTEVQK